MAFKFGYSTYALQMIDPFEAVRLIKESGYQAVEVCVREGWPTAPPHFPREQQGDLGKLCEDLGFPSPVLFGSIDVCVPEPDRLAMDDLTKQKFEMAHRLHFDDTPVLLTTTPGQSAPPWESSKEQIRDAFLHLGDMAARDDVVIAVEAHAGTDFETPEKAVWMMEQTNHPNLKLDLDISHFVVEGSDLVHSVDLCAPYTSMIHIKDGEKIDDEVQFCLTGAGAMDITAFLGVLRKNALEHMPVFVEVSRQQSSQPNYDPEAVAAFCFAALDNARIQLG